MTLLLLLASAWADGTVVALWESDSRGWASVEQAGEVRLIRDGQTVPVAVGVAVQETDLIQTDRGRVELELDDGQRITVYEGTELTLESWGVLQEIGTIFYRVRETFEVHYGTTEALVEGTRFWVSATPPSGSVVLEEGQVRVRNPQGELVLTPRSPAATFSDDTAPQPPDRTALRQARHSHWLAWSQRRRIPTQLGIMTLSGVGKQRGQTTTSARLGVAVTGRVELPGPLALTAASGLTNTTQTSQFPTDVGLVYALGRSGGIGLQGRMELGSEIDCAAGVQRSTARFGGSAVGTTTLPLSSRLGAEVRVVAGWAEGPWGDVGLALVLQ